MDTAQATTAFIVEGNNWRVKIPLDKDDLDMSFEDKVNEATSKGVEVFFGQIENDSFEIIDPKSPPIIGISLCVYDEIDSKDESKYVYLPSFVPLADSGHYKESYQMQQLFFAHQMSETEKQKAKLIARVGGLKNYDLLEKYSDAQLQRLCKNGKLPLTPKMVEEISILVEKRVQAFEKAIKSAKKLATRKPKKSAKKLK